MIEHLAQGTRHSRPTCLLPVQHINVSPVLIPIRPTDPSIASKVWYMNNPMPHLHVQRRPSPSG